MLAFAIGAGPWGTAGALHALSIDAIGRISANSTASDFGGAAQRSVDAGLQTVAVRTRAGARGAPTLSVGIARVVAGRVGSPDALDAVGRTSSRAVVIAAAIGNATVLAGG